MIMTKVGGVSMPYPVPPGVMVRDQVPIIRIIPDVRKPYNIVNSRLKVGPDMTRFERMEIIRRASWAANVSSLDVQQKEPLNFT
jgi:hypothetical protein